MTMPAVSRPFDVASPLEALAHELDPSVERLGRARDRYRDLGAWLKQHASQTAHPLAPTGLRKGKRAWALDYDDAFHMDDSTAVAGRSALRRRIASPGSFLPLSCPLSWRFN